MIRSQVIPLRLNKAQRLYVAKAAGTARFAYNWALGEWKRQAKEWWDSGKVSPYPGAYALQKQLTSVKHQQFPWMAEVAAEITDKAIASVEHAFACFRAGKARYPRFKSRNNRRSFVCGVRNADIHLDDDALHIRLRRIGRLRLGYAVRWPDAKILSTTISNRAGKWFISITCELPDVDAPKRPNEAAGVDLGIKSPIVVASGGASLQFGGDLSERLNVERRKLRRANKRLSRRTKGSGRRLRAQHQVARIHQRMTNIRSDFQHQATCRIARLADSVGVETLAVRNMMKNGRLARSIADVGFYEIRRQLSYKVDEVVEADRFYPSSKTCSNCGSVKETLSLSERTYHCGECGHECDRDVNAARNLEKMAVNWTVSARGDGSSAPVRKRRSSSPSMKREAAPSGTVRSSHE